MSTLICDVHFLWEICYSLSAGGAGELPLTHNPSVSGRAKSDTLPIRAVARVSGQWAAPAGHPFLPLWRGGGGCCRAWLTLHPLLSLHTTGPLTVRLRVIHKSKGPAPQFEVTFHQAVSGFALLCKDSKVFFDGSALCTPAQWSFTADLPINVCDSVNVVLLKTKILIVFLKNETLTFCTYRFIS